MTIVRGMVARERITGAELLSWLADEAGPAVAERLRVAAGGTRIWVPERPTERHRLTQLVGLNDATAIARVLGSGEFSVPTGIDRERAERKVAIARMTQQGIPADDIALKVRCHVRTVFRVRTRTHRALHEE